MSLLRSSLLLLAIVLCSGRAEAKARPAQESSLLSEALPAFGKVVRSSLRSLRMMSAERALPALTVAPVPGELTSRFGMRDDPVRKKRRRRRGRKGRRGKRRRMHKGLDFAADRHTPIKAAGSGVVVNAGVKGGYGRLVIIDHGNGLTTRYAHMQRLRVKKGQYVPAGAVIGTVGSSGRVTGPHLHFETRIDGKAVAPSEIVQFTMPPCRARSRDCRPQT